MVEDKSRNELMARIKQEFIVASVHELLQQMTRKCFKKCIDRPGVSLDAGEQRCIAMCMDRFMDSWSLVSQTFNNRLLREMKLLKHVAAKAEQMSGMDDGSDEAATANWS